MRVALAALPGPPSFELTVLVVLTLVPFVAPVTVTLNVQKAFAASVPPLNEIDDGAVVLRLPPQTEVGPLVAIDTPAGNGSVNPMPVSEFDWLGLVIVNDSVEVEPVRSEVGENDFPREGGAMTVSGAVA